MTKKSGVNRIELEAPEEVSPARKSETNGAPPSVDQAVGLPAGAERIPFVSAGDD